MMDNENMEIEMVDNQTEEQETIEETVTVEDRSIMTTRISDYTVTEGLLLVLTLCVFTQWLVKLLKGGFSWLLW